MSKERGIREQVAPEAYFPLTSALDNEWGWRMVVKTSTAPLTALGAIRNHVNALDNSLAVLIQEGMDLSGRRAAYGCDVTYASAKHSSGPSRCCFTHRDANRRDDAGGG